MPVLVPHDPNAPLAQGDLLGGVHLYVTGGAEQQPPAKWAHDLALVISRPCVAVNKPRVIVAAIEPFLHQLPKELAAQSLAELVKLMEEVRDADGSDAFYIGEIPGQGAGRYKARLDVITTLEVPVAAEARAVWTAARRRATLHRDFRRDLHTRFFLSIAKQGFDDKRWFSDEDLRMLVQFGQARVTAALQAAEQAEAAISQANATGTYQNKRIGLDKTLGEARAEHKKLVDELAGYQAELATRPGGGG